jgi:tRNA-dihydrouridine synthase B
MIKIGNVNINTNIFLAPLAGCSDLPFRLISREHGAKFCFYEMSDSNSLTHERRQSTRILKTHRKDSPIAAQLLGSDPAHMLDAAQRLLKLADTPFLDINCACPARKVIRKKAGAYLLRDTPRLYDILKTLTSSLSLPITIKIRTGYDKRDVSDIVKTAKECESLGVAAIFVHGRLMSQGYAGDIDYESIKNIKAAVKIPVLGSGNVLSPALAKKMFDETGCDGILVARGAFGNPWIFKDIEGFLKNGREPKPVSIETKKKALIKHLSYIDKYKDVSEHGKLGFMRKNAIWYLRSIPHAARARSEIGSAGSYADLLAVINNICRNFPEM